MKKEKSVEVINRYDLAPTIRMLRGEREAALYDGDKKTFELLGEIIKKLKAAK